MNQSSHHCQGNRKRHQEPLEDVCTFQLQELFNRGSTQEPDARTRPDIRGVDERKTGGGGLNWTMAQERPVSCSQQSNGSGTLAIRCFTWTGWFWMFFKATAETRRDHLSVTSKGTISPVYLSPGCITGVWLRHRRCCVYKSAFIKFSLTLLRCLSSTSKTSETAREKSEQSIYYLLKRCHLLAGIYSTALHNDEQHGSDVDLWPLPVIMDQSATGQEPHLSEMFT